MSDGPSRPDPVLDVRRTAGGFVACGEASVELGHRLPSTTGHARADGVWARWHWDGSTLTAETDRYGLWPLFHATGPGRIMVSSSLPRLVLEGAPTDLDHEALAVFGGLGHYLGDDTPLAGVRAVPPDGGLRWDGRLQTFGQFPPGSDRADVDRDEAIVRFLDAFRDAVWRRVRAAAPIVLPLSGGHDSRHILLALCELGRPPAACITITQYPPIAADDVEVARRLCRRLGIPHEVVAPLPRIEAELRKNVTCNFLADENAWYVPLADRLRDCGATLHGLAGDMLATDLLQLRSWVALLRAGDLSALADGILARGGQPGGRTRAPFLADDDTYTRVRARVVEGLREHATAPNPLTMFYFRTSPIRELGPMATSMLDGATCYCPFLDHAVFDLLTSLPVALKRGGFHTAALHRAYPGFADLPFSTPSPTHGMRAQYARFALDVGRYGVGREPGRGPGYVASLAGMAVAAARPYPRPRHEVPEWILYRWQLEDLLAGRIATPGRRTIPA